MRRVLPYLLIGAFLVMAGVSLAWYRNRSVVPGSEFIPRTSVRLVVPAGTQVHAVLKNLFSSGTKRGDAMLAFVTEPIVVDGSIAVPVGTRLNGIVEQITKKEPRRAQARMRFDSIVIDEKTLRIATDPLLANVTLESDFDILSNAADTLTEAGIGAAMGAAGRNRGGINAGMTAGALRAAAAVDDSNINITFVLSQPLDLIR